MDRQSRAVIRSLNNKYYTGHWYQGLPVWTEDKDRAVRLSDEEVRDTCERMDHTTQISYTVEQVE